MTEEVEMTVDVSEEEEPRLNINDIADCVKVIDLCSRRGAFEGNELETVGQLRGRLVRFVNAMVPEQEAPEETEEPTESAE